jgi:hypothetical protein
MKKILILFLFLSFGMTCQLQTIYSKFATNQTVMGVLDDTILYYTPSNQFINDQYQWLIWIDYDLKTGDSCTITVQTSGNKGVSWCDYGNGNYIKTLSDTSGTCGFEDYMLTGDFLRLKCTTGKNNGYHNIERFRLNAWIRATPIKKQ